MPCRRAFLISECALPVFLCLPFYLVLQYSIVCVRPSVSLVHLLGKGSLFWFLLCIFLVLDTRLFTLPCRSVCYISKLRAVFALLPLPNCPRLSCSVSGLVITVARKKKILIFHKNIYCDLSNDWEFYQEYES